MHVGWPQVWDRSWWCRVTGQIWMAVAIESIHNSFSGSKVKSNGIKQMLDSMNKKFFRLLVKKILWFTMNQRFDIFDYPATSKQTENCLVDPELHSASSWVFQVLRHRVMVKIVIDSCRWMVSTETLRTVQCTWYICIQHPKPMLAQLAPKW